MHGGQGLQDFLLLISFRDQYFVKYLEGVRVIDKLSDYKII